MTEQRLFIRSARARDLAGRLARRENTTVTDIVERALEAYEVREGVREPADAFYRRMFASYGTDIDLEAIIREGRTPRSGGDLADS
jgi:hypothetical protein